MSFEAMAWAVRQKTGSGGCKLVLLMLADYANSETGLCYPSHQKLAEKCEISTATVKRHIADLERDGFITVNSRSNDGLRASNIYRLNFSTIAHSALSMAQNVDSDSSNCHDSQLKMSYKPVIEPIKYKQEEDLSPARNKRQEKTIMEWLDGEKPKISKFASADWIDASPLPMAELWLKMWAFVMYHRAADDKQKDWASKFKKAVAGSWSYVTVVKNGVNGLWLTEQGKNALRLTGRNEIDFINDLTKQYQEA